MYNLGLYGLCINACRSPKVDIYTPSPSLNDWHAITFTRQNGTGYLFVDGVLKGSNAIGYDIIQANQLGTTDGEGTDISNTLASCYDEIVVIKGQSLWASNFDSDINWGYTWTPHENEINYNKIKVY